MTEVAAVPVAMSLTIRKRCFDEFIQTESGKEFLPEGKLFEILPDSAIKECLRECGFEEPWVEDFTKEVKKGARKILLILIVIREVKLIAAFVEHLRAHDSNLPFKQSDLNEILRDKAAVSDFYIRQWSIIPVFFSKGDTHRIYDEDKVFPFLSPTQRLPGGSFGEVAIVDLAETQHEFPDIQRERGKLRVVRKLLKSEGESESSSNSNMRPSVHCNEERILTLLRSLKHDNIIQLLASYTIIKNIPEHHLLFPCAECDLSKALQSESKNLWDSTFPSDYELFQQIYGLSSAIQCLHDYVGRDGLKRTGCHYDLKPQNILINKGRLLLADFGLSRLRTGENSKSQFVQGMGDYMAPECEQLQDGTFGKGIISRPSDIWSLGCIILEILTYHVGGKQHVAEFGKLRSNTQHLPFGSYTSRKFHCGVQPNVEVRKWLHRLTDEYPSTARFRPLVENMLKLEAKNRPKAEAVTSLLFYEAQRVIYGASIEIFKSLSKYSFPRKLEILQARFTLWGCKSSLHAAGEHIYSWMKDASESFCEISKSLFLFHGELQNLDKKREALPILKRLEELIDKLWKIQEEQENIQEEQENIQDPDDMILSAGEERLPSRVSFDNHLGIAPMEGDNFLPLGHIPAPAPDKSGGSNVHCLSYLEPALGYHNDVTMNVFVYPFAHWHGIWQAPADDWIKSWNTALRDDWIKSWDTPLRDRTDIL